MEEKSLREAVRKENKRKVKGMEEKKDLEVKERDDRPGGHMLGKLVHFGSADIWHELEPN